MLVVALLSSKIFSRITYHRIKSVTEKQPIEKQFYFILVLRIITNIRMLKEKYKEKNFNI